MIDDEEHPLSSDDDLLEEDRLKERRSLMGKIFSDRVIGVEAVRLTLGKIWKISKLGLFKIVGHNTYMIMFANEADKLRVMDGRPWLFD